MMKQILLITIFGMLSFSPANADTYWAFVGTYTGGKSEGIYVAEFDTATGAFGKARLAAASENPSFLAIHPNRRFLYAVGETGDYQGEDTGFVRAFSIDSATGKLSVLNTQRSDGAAPCHLNVDPSGKTVLVANYTGGSVASISLNRDGRLGEIVSSLQHVGSSVNPRRQNEAHAHSINLDLASRFAFAADLGMDKILCYEFDVKTGRLTPNDSHSSVTVPPGSGPRHFAFHPTGKFAYVINELLSTVVAFSYDADTGSLTAIQNISTLPENFDQPTSTAEIVVHPSGRFVYGSNRGHDSIAVFQVDPTSGKLKRVQVSSTGGRTPRNFAIDPSGQFLLAENQNSDNVVVKRIDAASGKLTTTENILQVPSPVCIRFLAK